MTDYAEKSATVLIIDDSDSIRGFAASLLQEAGHLVHQAVGGREGLDAMRSAPPDVVLLDVEMPGMSGYEVLAEMNRSERLYSVIMFTTLAKLQDIVTGLERGADDYIAKPFKEEELLARVNAGLRTARYKKQLAEARQDALESLEALKATQRQLVAQEKIASVARLAAGAAHNINNPLGFLMSNLVTLDRYADNLLAHSSEMAAHFATDDTGLQFVTALEKQHRLQLIRSDMKPLLAETREGARRIEQIVRRLAMLEMGLASQQRGSRFDLAQLVAALVSTMQSKAPEGVTISLERADGEFPVCAQLSLTNAAVEEVLTNACEAMVNRTGEITVAICRLDGRIQLKIADQGEGIPQGELAQVFDPFHTTKDQQIHVGLGLTIAERFVDLGGGRIIIASEPGAGTVCCLDFPEDV